MNIIDQLRDTNDGGVRKRADGHGDPWANQHRDQLGNACLMQDVDGIMGCLHFAQNTGERLFLEYVPDDYKNRLNVRRCFGIVAMFDRKKSRDSAMSMQGVLTRSFYLHLCRVIAKDQPVAPKFFFVTGEQAPWEMIELDIETGEEIGTRKLPAMQWQQVWQALGLDAIRNELTRWMFRKSA